MNRPFLTAGPQVARLLVRHRHVVARHLEFTGELSAAIAGDVGAALDSGPLPEPLTDREMAVLGYLPTMFKSAEIAADLFVSVNTVKTHQRAIYRKLGAANRREAVDQARALNLLDLPDRMTSPARVHGTP
jgi:LuxR family maltose regulon positive regulatory protein